VLAGVRARAEVNLSAGPGVAVREFKLAGGRSGGLELVQAYPLESILAARYAGVLASPR